MKIEARRNGLRLTLETLDLDTHAKLTDHRAAVEETLQRAASWFEAEAGALADPLAAFRPEPRR